MASKTSAGFNTLTHASIKTEKSIESFNTIGGRKEMLLEKNAQRLDEILKKSRERRKKVPENVKLNIEEKIYFATLKKEKIEEAKKIVENKNKSINDKAFKDFEKMLDVEKRDLFNVGYYIKNQHSARKSVGDSADSHPYEYPSRNHSVINKRKNNRLPKTSKSISF